jgi:hypothetical protein
MAELFFLIILVISFGGIAFIAWRHLNDLNALSKNATHGIKKHRIILDMEDKLKDIFLVVEKQVYLHKFLSWIKSIILKLEAKIDYFLHNIRKKAQQVDKKRKEKK